MYRRLVPLCGLFLLAGCFGDDTSSMLVSPSPFGPQARPNLPTRATHAPATEAVAVHVAEVGRKVLDANPQIALRPHFTTSGDPKPDVAHQFNGTSFESPQIVITEGLVRQCRGDNQLAAVLSLELARLVVEREALVPPRSRLSDRTVPPDVPVGNDSHGAFGSSDGTRHVELAMLDKQRVRPHTPAPVPPPPELLARGYLTRAGFASGDLDDVLPVLQRAEEQAPAAVLGAPQR